MKTYQQTHTAPARRALGTTHQDEDLFELRPESVCAIREFVATTLTRWDCTERLDDALVCVSELATNVVVHAAPLHDGFRVCLDWHAGRVRIEVHDGGTRTTSPRVSTAEDGGWGLHLVQRLSDASGVVSHNTGDGKGIWCELKVRPRTTNPIEGKHSMPLLTDRVPTLSHRINAEPTGPMATRPFGLDALTTPVTVGAPPVATVEPDSQLSLIDGKVALDVAAMAGTACNTPSDGKDAIAVDHDENDD